MRVHQPGSHLTDRRGARVDDWSWRQTKRRLSTLHRLARPYRAQTAWALVSLLGATIVGLAPPFLVGRAVDAVRHGRTHELTWYVAAFLAATLSRTTNCAPTSTLIGGHGSDERARSSRMPIAR